MVADVRHFSIFINWSIKFKDNFICQRLYMSNYKGKSVVLLVLIFLAAGNKIENVNYYTIMQSDKRWVVTTSNTNSFMDLTNELIKNGFVIDQVLSEIGCITGTGSDEVAKKMRSVSGVTDVSPESNIDIGPPDSTDTW